MGLSAKKVTRTELPARPQSHGAHRARRWSARGVTVVEIGPGPGGLTRALLAAGADASSASSVTRAPLRRSRELADALSRAPRHNRSGCTRFRSATPPRQRACPHRRQPALQYRDGVAGAWLSIEPWPPWYDILVADVPARSGRTHRRRAWHQQLWPLVGAVQLALRDQSVCSTLRRSASCRPRRSRPPWCGSPRARILYLLPLTDLERVTAAAFGQRRKMLRQSLKTLVPDPLPLLATAGLDPAARAQDIPVEGFVALAQALSGAAAQ